MLVSAVYYRFQALATIATNEQETHRDLLSNPVCVTPAMAIGRYQFEIEMN